MFSRAHLLIQNTYKQYQTDAPWGIEAYPLTDDNIFEWTAKIKGLKDTLWEGGVFRLYLKFDENYNLRPPEMCFHTIPFHPNIDMVTGRPCLDFLDDWSLWQHEFSLSSMLQALQCLLANPVLEHAINAEAAEMALTTPHSYRQIVLDCVTASQRVEAGLSPQPDMSKVRFKPPEEKSTESPQSPIHVLPMGRVDLSFEDYHLMWSGIATSKGNPRMRNPILEMIRGDHGKQASHMGLTEIELIQQQKRHKQEHRNLIYGRFNSTDTDEFDREERLQRVEQMKKIYLPCSTGNQSEDSRAVSRSNHTVQLRNNAPCFQNKIQCTPRPGTLSQPITSTEPWEQDVDDLVAWTSQLDPDMVDA